ncbi:spermidine N(1)-acetyltransferase [Bordetella holmesii ATCC 51541]|nr:spermidine N(1)-acetyltransferase [Bordetella holmesii ATCC 51541]
MLNLHKVYLVVDKQNEAAVHIYQACGFSVEGELREEFFPMDVIAMLTG